MLSGRMQEALINQMTAELYSSYLYLSMSAYFESTNLPGFANWMRMQAKEELAHAMKFYDYVNARGGRVRLQEIEAPPSEWASPLAVFQETYSHEQKVTGLINDLATLAMEERDHAATVMLQWFVNEQVEEEESANNLVQQLMSLADAPGGLYMMDRELAKRVFVPPTETADAT